MPEITIKEFKGYVRDNSKWGEAFGGYVVGLDIYGLANNSSQLSIAGVPQGLPGTSAGLQATGVSGITELVTDFARYESQDFAVGANNPVRIYRRDSGAWTWVSAISAENSVTYATLQPYQNELYYAQKNFLGQYNNTNSSSQFQSFSDSDVGPRPMKVFAGSLFIGDNRYIAKYDGTNFTAQALTLPSDFVIRSMEVYADRLYISADNNDFAKLFVWDGVSPTFETFIEIKGERVGLTLQTARGFLWAIGENGVGKVALPLYIFNGVNLEIFQLLPIGRGRNHGLTEYQGGLGIMSSNDSAFLEDGTAGLWLVNQYSEGSQYFPVLGFTFRDTKFNMFLGAVKNNNGILYMAAQDVGNGSFEIFETQPQFAIDNCIWQSLPIDAKSTNRKVWHGIEVNFEKTTVGEGVVIKYRTDEDSSFTTVKTYSTGGDVIGREFIKIGRIARAITIRIELTAEQSSNRQTTKLNSFTLRYSPTNV